MGDTTTYSDASRVLEAVRVLEALEKSGEITAAEQAALDKYRAEKPAMQGVADETGALYRGLAKGLSFNLRDEGAGALAAMTGGSYADTRDSVRAADAAAQAAAPDAFGKGELAGGLLPMGATAGVGLGLGKGMGLLGQMGLGALTGGASGFGYGFAGGEGGFKNRVEDGIVPGAIGATMGGLAPGVGRLAGKAVRGLENMRNAVPGYGPLATKTMAGALDKTPMPAAEIQAYLDSLGPSGIMADIPGPARRTAQGLASMPGAGGAELGGAIESRARGASDRIKGVVDDVIGAPDAAFAERTRLAQERAHKLGPEYEAALNHQEAIDASDIGAALSEIGGDAVGNVAASVNRINKELGFVSEVVDGKTVEKYAPITAARLHNIRSELSDDIDEARRAGRGKFVAQMAPVLKSIDDKLDAIPGYAEARTGYANNKAMERAIEDGRAVFRGGEASAKSPRELEAEIKRLSPAQLDAYRKGAREYVAALMGTSRNDAAAAWGAFAKEWNAEKLAIVLGKSDADKVIARLKAEQVFSQTRGDVLKGSQTAQRTEAANELADLREPDGAARPGPIKRAMRAVGGVGNTAVDSLLYGPRRTAANAELGAMLSATGPERDRLVADLLAEAMRRGKPSLPQNMISGLLQVATQSSAPAVTSLLPR